MKSNLTFSSRLTLIVLALTLVGANVTDSLGQASSSYDGWSSVNEELVWHTDLESAKKLAIEQDKFVLLHFTATWCRPCKTLETFVFSSKGVQSAMNETVVAVKIDADEEQALVSEFGVTQVPFDIIMTPGGQVVSKRRSPKDVRNYTHMISQLQTANRKLQQGSEGSKSHEADFLRSSLTGTQQASFKPKMPKPNEIGLSVDSSFLAQRSNNYDDGSMGKVQKNPFLDATTQGSNAMNGPSGAENWQDREALERKQFLERQQLAQRAQQTRPQPKPQRIINNQFFDKAASIDTRPAKSLAKPQVSDMIPASQTGDQFATQASQVQIGGEVTRAAQTPVNDAPFKMPADLRGNAPVGGTSFVAAKPNTPMTQQPSSPPKPPVTNQAPVDRSKFCLQGKCPVTLLKEGRWEDGDAQFGIVHRDRVYIFANANCLAEFKKNPDGYSPILAGFDPVVYHENGELKDGKPEHGVFMGTLPNQRVVLFESAETRDKFQGNPQSYLDTVRQAMRKADGSGIMR